MTMKNGEQKLRVAIQIFFFVLVGLIAANHTLAESGVAIPFLSTASIHAICPFGGVETFYQLLTTGDYIQKIHSSALVLMGIVFTLTILFGPVFCGWICPLGSIQEWVGKIGKRLLGKRYNQLMPRKLDKILRYLRYVVLILVMYNTAVSGMLLFADVDPYYALFHFWTGETAVAALIILGITLGLSLFVERPWCKYACPYGALLGLFNPFHFFKIKRKASTCIDCGKCDRACPMNIEVSKKDAVNDHQCISCLVCTSESICPIDNTVQMLPILKSADPAKSKVKAIFLAPIILVMMFGGIMITSALGLYTTENDKVPNRIEEGDAAGSYDPEEIKGSYSLQEVSDLYDIPGDVLIQAFGLPVDTDLNTFKSKNIEELYEGAAYEIGNGSLKTFVALYQNLPIGLGDEFLPQTAVDLILEHNLELTDEQILYLETHTYHPEGAQNTPADVVTSGGEVGETTDSTTVESAGAAKLDTAPEVPLASENTTTSTGTGAGDGTGPGVSATGEEPAVNGQITFQGLLNLGITKEEIEQVLGAPMPATNFSLRTYCQNNSLPFSEIKAAFTALLE